MLIVALVLAVIGLAALVTAVVTSNELIAWVCIGASVIGVILLIVDALRERSRGASTTVPDDEASTAVGHDDETTTLEPSDSAEDYPDEPVEDTGAESLVQHEQAIDPANDDLPPNTTPERI